MRYASPMPVLGARPASRGAAVASIVGGCALLGSCRAPTEITVVVTTDFDCSQLDHVTVSVGSLGDAFESSPPATASTECTDGYVGRLVVVPKDGKTDAVVGIKVVGGYAGKRAEDCVPAPGTSPPDYGSGCIVARRALAYVPHAPLTVPVVLRSDCDGVSCPVDQTCVGGTCSPALCAGGSCDDCSLFDGGCGDGGLPSPYHDITAAANWLTFDLSSIVPATASFAGGAFDGRYVYFAPAAGSVFVRFDTQGPYGSGSSWTTYASTVPVSNYRGAVFDGRYVYFVPDGAVVTRYDSQASFADPAAWSTFVVAAPGYSGGVFDGRYVTLVPSGPTDMPRGVAARYDTHAPFAAAGSWASFDASTLGTPVRGCVGGVYDGRYVYLVPNYDGVFNMGGIVSHQVDGVVGRYDTSSAFDAAGSWTTFDAMTLNSSAEGFQGGAFDGRYVYLVPGASAFSTVAVRYDSQASFSAAASWSTFDVDAIGHGALTFAGAAFDGRYVYLAPNPTGFVVRYDTSGPFGAAPSWSSFDASTLDKGARGFWGAIFDGQYVYFVPNAGKVAARFEARGSHRMPAGYSGSFY